MLLNYDDQGPGPVVLLLHGFPLNRTMWEAQRETIGSMYRVIAPDLRGHGRTAAPEGIYAIEDMADDVVEMLDALRITEPIVLGGLSMGGYIALDLAVRHPKRLRGLMLMNTRATADTPEAARAREDLAREVELSGSVAPVAAAMASRLVSEFTRQNRPEIVSRVAEMIDEASPRGVAGALRGMAARADRTGDLERITVPTLVLTGAAGALIPAAESRRMAEALPNAGLVEIPQAGHLAPLENPMPANEAILRFLGGLA